MLKIKNYGYYSTYTTGKVIITVYGNIDKVEISSVNFDETIEIPQEEIKEIINVLEGISGEQG